MATLLGFLAAALSTFSLVPQVVRTVRTRSAGDLAWGYLITMLIAGVAWTGYGVLHHDVAVIVANAVAVSLASVIVATKVAATRRQAAQAPVEFAELAELADEVALTPPVAEPV